MGILRQFGEYLFIKKRDPNQPRTQWMKYMHGMNRISLLIFIFAILFTLFRVFILPLFKLSDWHKRRIRIYFLFSVS